MLSYQISGKGSSLVFLHGYLESMEIWQAVFEKLKSIYKIILIDLPGHGKSAAYSKVHTMEFMAEKVNEVIEKEGVEKCCLFGHSMGGYVALAFAGLYPEKLEKLVLVHSHPFADSGDKVKDRDREIELILSGKKHIILASSIPRLYADINLEPMKDKIKFSKKIAEQMNDEAIVAALEGMKTRINRSDVFDIKNFEKHIIIGKHDNLIPAEKLINFASEKNIPFSLLEKSGHMGFFEEEEKFLRIIEEVC